jgi:hypothetical protein
LVKIYGWFEFEEIHFIIMGGVFQTSLQINEFYDLKGSTIGRSSKGTMPKKDLDIEPKRFKFPKDEKEKCNQIHS